MGGLACRGGGTEDGAPASTSAAEARRAPPPTDPPLPWWRSAVFYEVFVRSFSDSTSGPLAGDGVGDLRGLLERLDHLNDGDPRGGDDLGVTALWLMPVTESPSYHGYDVVDYRRIDPEYGTNEEFRRLVAEAHRRGVRVVVDLVLNHTSSDHPWFRDAWRPDSRWHDWYIWSREPQTVRGPWGQEVWHATPWWQRGWRRFLAYGYYGIFWSGMPDLNHRNPEVVAESREISRFWLEEMGADGFRLDAIRHLIEDLPVQEDTPETHEWLRGYQEFVHHVRPDALTVGEVWADTETVASYGPDELDLTFQFELAEAILEAARWGRSDALTRAVERLDSAFPGGRYATFLTNHDQVRTRTVLGGSFERSRMAASLLLTLPGTPFLYYGEEIGVQGAKPDPELRKPLPWTGGPKGGFTLGRPWQELDAEAATVNVAAQDRDPESLLHHYRRLIALRNEHPALRVGDLELVPTGHDRVVAWWRRTTEPAEALLVLVNLGDDAVNDYHLDPSGLPEPMPDEAPVDLLAGRPTRAPTAADPRPVAQLAARRAYVLAWPQRPAAGEGAGGS